MEPVVWKRLSGGRMQNCGKKGEADTNKIRNGISRQDTSGRVLYRNSGIAFRCEDFEERIRLNQDFYHDEKIYKHHASLWC